MKQLFRIVGIGMAMGAAEIVPGVSGGTIAFVAGIYERLVNAIRQFTPMLLLDLKNNGLKQTWQQVDANFVLALFGGMGISIVLLAGSLSYLMANQPVLIWSFFFGLVVASVGLVLKQITKFGFDTGIAIGVGLAFGYVITNLSPITLQPTPLHMLLGGAVAICAWILPGISGSFILLILGLYRFVIEAIKDFDLLLLMSLAAGCAIGIVSFAQVISRLFQNYRNQTLAVLTGFMAGSIAKLWPWRHTLSYQIKSDGSQMPLVEEPISPMAYADLTGMLPQYEFAAIGLGLGFIAVYGLHLLSKSHE